MGTSRGPLSERRVHIIALSGEDGTTGFGECTPVPGLSLDARADLQDQLARVCREVTTGRAIADLELDAWPAIRFAVECAWRDLQNGGKGVLFESDFVSGNSGIVTHGLIHMGTVKEMQEQLLQKIQYGFHCLKVKVAHLSLEQELAFLRRLREICPFPDFELRLDANGAFDVKDALPTLEQFAELDVHSIEQPIRPGQRKAMRDLCERSPVPVALDEELIGAYDRKAKAMLLHEMRPAFIILKPTLLGGFSRCLEWQEAAEQLGVGYWAGSILESNVGLSALCQWAATMSPEQVPALGTGRLFRRNFDTGVFLRGNQLFFDSGGSRAGQLCDLRLC